MYALELWDLLDEGSDESKQKFIEMVEEEGDEEETVEPSNVKKPSKPVFAMTSDEVAVYYGVLLKDLYKLEGLSKFKLWPKKDSNGSLIATATPLKLYDEKANEILPRDSYFGRGSGGPNIGNKLKFVAAYLLSKINIDHNSFAEKIPANYKSVEVNIGDGETNIIDVAGKAPKAHKSRLQKAKSTLSNRPAEKRSLSPDDIEMTKTKKAKNSVAIPSTPSSSFVSRLVAGPSRLSVRTPASQFLTRIGELNQTSPGTPTVDNDSYDDLESANDPLIYSDIDVVKAGNVFKAHKGLITTVDIFDVEICKTNGLYRGSISDGVNRSNKVLFDSKLKERVEIELLGQGKVTTIKLETVEIMHDVLIGISDYTVIGKDPEHVGDAEFVGNGFYRTLKPRGCFTPSRMKKRMLFS